MKLEKWNPTEEEYLAYKTIELEGKEDFLDCLEVIILKYNFKKLDSEDYIYGKYLKNNDEEYRLKIDIDWK